MQEIIDITFLYKHSALFRLRMSYYRICLNNLLCSLLLHLLPFHQIVDFHDFFGSERGGGHVQSSTCSKEEKDRLTSLHPIKDRNTPRGYPILMIRVRAEASKNPVPYDIFADKKVKSWKNTWDKIICPFWHMNLAPWGASLKLDS